MDDGENCLSVILNRQASERYLEKSMEEVSENLSKVSHSEFIKNLRSKLLGNLITIRGRSIVDQQGAMFLTEELEVEEIEPKEFSSEIKMKWGI